jgi:predicted CXXCH cytochrome family protein
LEIKIIRIRSAPHAIAWGVPVEGAGVAEEDMEMMRSCMAGRPVCGRVLGLLLLAALFALCLIAGGAAVETHTDPSKVKGGCGACHKGHGKRGTAMLSKTKEELCFNCHGGGSRGGDIYAEVAKPSSHPIIQSSRFHEDGEELPERNPSAPRHVACADCHNSHRTEKDDALKGTRGYSGRGQKVAKIRSDYEICYKCHSDSANIPKNKRITRDFEPGNASFHPVEAYGKSTRMPSLVRGYTVSSLIKCTDCHGNNDPSGPKGPHGSIYEPILKFRYFRGGLGPESPTSYALCYECHNRASILGDESFKAHKTHVVTRQIACSLCHASHGSQINPRLINFDTAFAFPNSKGEFSYQAGVPGTPRCLLSCHVSGKAYDHAVGASGQTVQQPATAAGRFDSRTQLRPLKGLEYCVNGRCPPGW